MTNGIYNGFVLVNIDIDIILVTKIVKYLSKKKFSIFFFLEKYYENHEV
jgi:hypothetical protein